MGVTMWQVIRWGNGDLVAEYDNESDAKAHADRMNGTCTVVYVEKT